MAGYSATDDIYSRSKGICPDGWAMPTKVDFTSANDSYWPTADNAWGGNTAGWNKQYGGYCDPYDTESGPFYMIDSGDYLWSSSEYFSFYGWYQAF